MLNKFAKWVFAVTIAMALLFSASPASAQSNVSGSISGTVTGRNGSSVIAGATVTITNTDRGEDIRAKNQYAGFYTAAALPLGTYKVTFAAAAFKTEVVTGLVSACRRRTYRQSRYWCRVAPTKL